MKYLGMIILLVGGINVTAGVAGGEVMQIIIGAVLALTGSTVYNRKQNVLPAGTQQNAPRAKFEITDEMLVKLAKRLGNKLSVEDLTQQTSLTRDQAKERLEQMHQSGLCQIDLQNVEESGKIYYHF